MIIFTQISPLLACPPRTSKVVEEKFKKCDVDSNGKIDFEEIQILLTDLGIIINNDELQKKFSVSSCEFFSFIYGSRNRKLMKTTTNF